MSKNHELLNFIWSIADLLRGPYRPPQYECVMLSLVVLRRFDRLTPPRPLAEIDADLKRAEEEIVRLPREATMEMRA